MDGMIDGVKVVREDERAELADPRDDTPDNSKQHSQIRIAIKPVPVRRKRRRVVHQRRRQVVARLERVYGVLAVALGVGAVADEDL